MDLIDILAASSSAHSSLPQARTWFRLNWKSCFRIKLHFYCSSFILPYTSFETQGQLRVWRTEWRLVQSFWKKNVRSYLEWTVNRSAFRALFHTNQNVNCSTFAHSPYPHYEDILHSYALFYTLTSKGLGVQVRRKILTITFYILRRFFMFTQLFLKYLLLPRSNPKWFFLFVISRSVYYLTIISWLTLQTKCQNIIWSQLIISQLLNLNFCVGFSVLVSC